MRKRPKLSKLPGVVSTVSATPELSQSRPLILLAEDEAIIAIDLADSLTRAGFDVAGPFATCAQAEGWLKTGAPDAAILDNLLQDGPCDDSQAVSRGEVCP